jgi:hypothetical protein
MKRLKALRRKAVESRADAPEATTVGSTSSQEASAGGEAA